jgi:NADPH-dependent 7-cyano-7-deazaguanine reductase QueF-like protein
MLLNNDLQVAEDKSYLDSFNNCEIKNIEDVKRKLKQFSDNL